jgi:hypothetical protein
MRLWRGQYLPFATGGPELTPLIAGPAKLRFDLGSSIAQIGVDLTCHDGPIREQGVPHAAKYESFVALDIDLDNVGRSNVATPDEVVNASNQY